MDWATRMNLALDYIEENLASDIDFKQAARLALCSVNHFSSMFLMLTGITPGEYIRRRRLSLAALELQHSGERIIDISLRYGYASPTAFNRAFQNQHKVSPNYARSRRVPLVTYPRISLQINLKGDAEMKCRIEAKPAFTVIGVKKTFRTDATENRIPSFWDETPTAVYDQLRVLNDVEPKWFVGLCADFDGEHTLDYYIAAASTQAAPEGFETREVPAATWAIIEQEGGLTDLVNRFWSEWLPSSGYRRADENVPDLEIYPDKDMPKDGYRYELWFPIVKE